MRRSKETFLNRNAIGELQGTSLHHTGPWPSPCPLNTGNIHNLVSAPTKKCPRIVPNSSTVFENPWSNSREGAIKEVLGRSEMGGEADLIL